MSSTPEPETEVLVAGAGPVGLSLAIDLARRGVAVEIIDTLAEPTQESRAIVVHSRTLDHFEALGVLDDILDRSIKSTGMEMHSDGKTVVSVSFDHIHATHPFSVSLVQCDTEAVLTARLEALGVQVERASTLSNCTTGDDGVRATITGPEGTTRTVRAQYLVGADGARSAVRHLMGQELSGSFVGEDVLLCDVEGDHAYEQSHFHAFFSPGETSGLLFPLRGNRVRVFAQLPDGTDPKRPLTLDWMQQVVDERGIKLKITSSHWLTRFELKHGQVPQYRSGRVFLAGDAAHIHSPAGALGMNTGIQDAINLGWKLALTLHGGGGDTLLQSYHLERHPVGAQVVFVTTEITKVATITNPLAQRLRNTLMQVGMHAEPLMDKMADMIEQQQIHYHHSPVVSGSKHHKLRPGDFLHLPDTHIAAKLAATTEHVAIVMPEKGAAVPAAVAAAGISEIQIAANDMESLRTLSGLKGQGIVIVRPDGYVGFTAEDPEQGAAEYVRLLAS